MEKDLDKCKEMINIRMQRDVDYDKLTKEEREILVGPDRLTSLHKALKKIGVSVAMDSVVISIIAYSSLFAIHRIQGRR